MKTSLSLWYGMRKGLIFLIKRALVQRTSERAESSTGPLEVLVVMDHRSSGNGEP